MKILFFISSIFLLFTTCQNETNNQENTNATHPLIEIKSPCKNGGEPNLFTSETGEVYLSWIEYEDDTTDVLQFSKLNNGEWTTEKTIASGSNWFVNWADFPSLVAYKDGGQSLAAHWLQTSAPGTYDYDVRIAQSFDSGQSWAPSFIPHLDGIHAEHGFVSMLPISDDRIFVTWLDGRNTKGEEQESKDGHGHHGAMSLRAAIFDKKGHLYDEVELDNKVCDCCQTSVAMTDQGIIVAYRNRSEDEMRDIDIVRQIDGEWTVPALVFADNWHITGCPVNGPTIKADGKNVVVAWYTRANEKPQVKVAFSQDSGATFSSPIHINEGKALGRVDLVLLAENEAIVSWIEENNGISSIKAVKVNSTSKIGDSFIIAHTNNSRQSGFPVMTKRDKDIVFAWTHVDSLTTVRTVIMKH